MGYMYIDRKNDNQPGPVAKSNAQLASASNELGLITDPFGSHRGAVNSRVERGIRSLGTFCGQDNEVAGRWAFHVLTHALFAVSVPGIWKGGDVVPRVSRPVLARS